MCLLDSHPCMINLQFYISSITCPLFASGNFYAPFERIKVYKESFKWIFCNDFGVQSLDFRLISAYWQNRLKSN